jgi:hypothetical protein
MPVWTFVLDNLKLERKSALVRKKLLRALQHGQKANRSPTALGESTQGVEQPQLAVRRLS